MKSLAELGLTAYDESCWLNIEPYMHPHPHRVPLNTSLPFIFRLFRGLGLRYLFVVNDDNHVRFTKFIRFILISGFSAARSNHSERRRQIPRKTPQPRVPC